MFWWRSIPLVILEYAHLDFYHIVKCLQRPASRLRLHENLSGEIVFFEASHYKILDSYFPAFLAEYPVSLSVFMTFPYFEPITFGMREQMKSCSSSTAWGFWVNWSFYYNVEFLIFIYFMLIFIYYNLVLPHCIKFSILWDSHTRSALGAKSWLDDRSLKLELLSVTAHWEVQNVHFLSCGTCRLKNYFLMQSDLRLPSTNLCWAAKSELPQMPSLHLQISDKTFGYCSSHFARVPGTTQLSAGDGRKWDLEFWEGIKKIFSHISQEDILQKY